MERKITRLILMIFVMCKSVLLCGRRRVWG
jgi:hypothetical protein